MNTIKNRLIQKLLLNKKAKKQNGFTLIELMVVVAIVGILSSVGVPQLLKAQDKARDAAAVATLTNAAKECSLVLVTEGVGTNFDIQNYTTGNPVQGDCETNSDDALYILSEASGADTYSVNFDAGGIPSPAVVTTAVTGTDGSVAAGGGGGGSTTQPLVGDTNGDGVVDGDD